MTTPAFPSYAGHRFPAEIISHAVWLYFRFPLSLGMVEEMLAARGMIVSHETMRQWDVRGDDGHEEDRSCRDRGSAAWMRLGGLGAPTTTMSCPLLLPSRDRISPCWGVRPGGTARGRDRRSGVAGSGGGARR